MPIQHEIIDHSLTIKRTNGRGSSIDHWHQRTEFIYVLEGECVITIGKQQRRCTTGDLAVIRSGQIHSLSGDTVRELYIVTFDPVMFYHLLPEARFPKQFVLADEQRMVGLAEEIPALLHKIYQEMLGQEPLCDPLMRADILRLYSLLVRHFEEDSPQSEKTKTRLQQFQTVLEFIVDHYAEQITLADLAKVVSYTPSYVSTLFTTCTGVNFKVYLNNFRIKKAADLLRSTNQTVTDIAHQCGYDNVRTFNDAFRRVTGQSPSQFRKNNT